MASNYSELNVAYELSNRFKTAARPMPDSHRDPDKSERNRRDRENSRARKEQRLNAAREERRAETYRQISANKRFRMIVAVLILGAGLLCVIMLTALSTSIQSNINITNQQIREVENDIGNLNLQLERECNSIMLTEKAEEMGLITPTGDQIVYVGDPRQLNGLPENIGLAQFIRENAYESS